MNPQYVTNSYNVPMSERDSFLHQQMEEAGFEEIFRDTTDYGTFVVYRRDQDKEDNI